MIIAVAILAVVLLMAVPSLNGVLADRRLRESLDSFNTLVRKAQERSVREHRAYLIVWGDNEVFVQPEEFRRDEDTGPIATMPVQKGSALSLALPAALSKKPQNEWIFWPTGTCEPAVVEYTGRAGTWTATYSPLTANAELSNYATR
jgi:type II secretory pathway pseudopilin PulG